ncbi:hypothetical protein GCM10009092_37510 [Bowmanella denitrificans]|uniref:Uncharacterized protein n=1 Tax=Bowmanella denitrificans TaxID=366582 RepID=A0ABP3HJN8_9ALTE
MFNLGMPGIGLERQFGEALKQIEENTQLESIIFSLDYLDFLYTREDFERPGQEFIWQNLLQPRGMQQRARDVSSLLLSLDTLFSSIKTMAKQHVTSSHISAYGSHYADSYINIMQSEGIKPLFSQKLKQIAQSLQSKRYVSHLGQVEKNPGLKMFATFLEKTRLADIEVTFFISPYHYTYLHMLNKHNHWQSFLQWKMALVSTIEPYKDGHASLWDFSGFSSYTMEPVDFTQPRKLMKWYWEPAHYRSELGEVMLKALTKSTSSSDFARKMEQSTVRDIIILDQKALLQSAAAWQAFSTQIDGD